MNIKINTIKNNKIQSLKSGSGILYSWNAQTSKSTKKGLDTRTGRIIDVLDEQYMKQTKETIIPKLEKLINLITSGNSSLDYIASRSKEKKNDFDYVDKLRSDILENQHEVTKKELQLCNIIWKKYKQLNQGYVSHA